MYKKFTLFVLLTLLFFQNSMESAELGLKWELNNPFSLPTSQISKHGDVT